MNESLLEPDYDASFREWQASPGPQANAKILQDLNPVIDRALRAHVGRSDPLLRSRARRMALTGLNSYDPKRSGLSTHMFHQLNGMKRYAAQRSQPMQVPERVSLDRRALELASRNLADELGRDPTDEEVSGATGLSAKRIRYVRTYTPAMSTGQWAGATSSEQSPGGFDAAVPQNATAWVRLVYDDLGPLDKKIMEWTLGLNGQPRLSNAEIAARLRRSPGAISQHKMQIQRLLDQEPELSPFN